jgi:hypothetical protein
MYNIYNIYNIYTILKMQILNNRNYIIWAIMALSLFFYEHIGRIYAFRYRPTSLIILCTNYLQIFFYYIGVMYGYIILLIEFLHFENIYSTICDINNLIIDLFKSVTFFKDGVIHVCVTMSSNCDTFMQIYKFTGFVVLLLVIISLYLTISLYMEPKHNK